MFELDCIDCSVNVFRLDGSPLSTYIPISTSIEQLYREITKRLPQHLAERRKCGIVDIELHELDDNFLEEIVEYAHYNVGHLCEEVFMGQKFKKRYSLTVRELFFQKIVEYGISFKHAKSYNFLDILTFSSPIEKCQLYCNKKTYILYLHNLNTSILVQDTC
jgi:hypothetical protein